MAPTVFIEDRSLSGGVVREDELREAAARILRTLGADEAELSLVLVDDEEMARLNARYLQRSGPTNVLAFPMREGEGGDVMPHLLGDVVISLETARREAETAGIPWEERVLTLLIHGILHLLGWDHERGLQEAEAMEAQERRILEAVRGVLRFHPP